MLEIANLAKIDIPEFGLLYLETLKSLRILEEGSEQHRSFEIGVSIGLSDQRQANFFFAALTNLALYRQSQLQKPLASILC